MSIMTKPLCETLNLLRTIPAGATDQELADRLGINLRTLNWRRIRLHRAGLVTPCGVRDTGAKIKQTIWRACDG